MKIAKLIFCLVLVLIQTFVFAQKKKTTKIIPPPVRKPVQFVSEKENPIYKIIANNEGSTAFSWKIDKDTLLVKNSLFSETVQFNCYDKNCDDAEIVKNSTAEDFQMKKENKEDKYVTVMGSFFSDRKRYDFNFNKNILTLTNSETKLKQQFKVNLDKKGKTILSLQDTKTKKLYLPSEPDYPSVSMGN